LKILFFYLPQRSCVWTAPFPFRSEAPFGFTPLKKAYKGAKVFSISVFQIQFFNFSFSNLIDFLKNKIFLHQSRSKD